MATQRDEALVARDLGVRQLLVIFAALSIALLCALAVAPARSMRTEWRSVQKRYNELAGRARMAMIPIGLRQIWKPELAVTDRCGSCHLAADGAEPVAGDTLFAAHPPIPHDPRQFGCTVCHGGQGRATTAEAAHGHVAHWDEPLLPRGYTEAGCGTCHSHIPVPAAALADKGRVIVEEGRCRDCHRIGGKLGPSGPDLSYAGGHGFRPDWHARHVEKAAAATGGPWAESFAPLAEEEVVAVDAYLRTLFGAPRLVQAKRLAYQRGCRGCHRIGGVGGDDGPDLSDEGHRREGDLDYRHVSGPHDLRGWLKAHFLDPPLVAPGSKMPKLGFAAEEADLLSLYMLSLRSRPMPESLAPRDRVRGARLGERDFASDGASLFGVFCAACHGPRGEGRKFETFTETFPAIGSQAFLALADDGFLRKTLREGRPGRRMPAWGRKDGGLRPEEIDALVGYLRSLEPPPPSMAEVQAASVDETAGKRLFKENCAPCHGTGGEGTAVGPPIAAPDDPVTVDDSRIFGTLVMGVAGTAMGSFRDLDAGALRSLIATVRSLPKVAAVRTGWTARPGDARRGADGFKNACARCHGERAEGKDGPALANPAFLAAASDGFLTATIIRGRGTTAMPHFGRPSEAERLQLSAAEVADIVAWLRSRAVKPEPAR